MIAAGHQHGAIGRGERPARGLRGTSGAVLAWSLVLVPAAGAAQSFPSAPPPATAVAPARFPPFQRATLANGLQIIVVSNHRLPVLSMTLAFAAGSQYDADDKVGTAEMVAGLLTKGAGTRDADAVAAAIEGVGGSLVASASLDVLTISANVLSEHAPLAFELLADAVMRPAFASSEIDLYRTQALSSLQLELSQPAAIASRLFAARLYGRHPYGRRPNPASVRAITRDDLVEFQTARLRPGGALLVLAGDITLDRARQLAGVAFRGWSGAAAAVGAAAPAVPTRSATEIVLVHRPGSVQSNIIVGNVTWPAGDPRHHAITVANKVLGGGADARLFMILREQKGWTYGAYSGITRYRGPGYFSATAEVRTDVTDSSLREMLSQLNRIRAETIPAREFDDARSSLVGRFPLEIETAAQVAGQVANAHLLGLPPDYVQTYRQRLAAVTPAAALAAAQAAIQPDRALALVVGDGAKLLDKLRAIAPVRIISPEGAALTADDLVVKALDVDLARLVPRSDSFAVFVQGNAFGFQRSRLEKAGDRWTYVEEVQLGAMVQQRTEVVFGADLTPISVAQSGQQAGQQMRIDVTYAAGRARGSATTPSPAGAKTIAVDADVARGAVDDNMVTALLPTFRWAPGAKFTVNVFQSGKGTGIPVTLTVSGEETVTVPAGTIPSWRVDLGGAEQPVTFWVEKAAPHRLVKIGLVGAPIDMRLVR